MIELVVFIILLAMLAIVVFFTFPRFLEWIMETVVELAAAVLCRIEDAVQDWKELFEDLREDRKK